MKKKLTNNLGLKILSVFLAIMLWLVVLNVSDPEKTATIYNIPITILNEEAVTGLDKVYEVVAGKTASVRVTGPRTIIDSLEASSFIATADLSKLSMTNAVEVDVELVTPSYRSKVDIDVETTLKIKVEDLLTKEFTAEVITKGNPAEGYVKYDQSLKEKRVKVTAPQSIMDTIAKVGVIVDLSEANSDFTVTADFKAFDNRGNALDPLKQNITFSVKESVVDVVIYPVKQIPIKFDINEEDYPNTVISSTTISRDYIMVAGRKENLDEIKEITLDTSNLEIKEDTSTYELRYQLEDLLPEGVYVYGEDKNVSIKVETDAIIEKTFSVAVNDIAIKSLGDGFSAAHETTGNIEYTLRGRKSLLDKFDETENALFVSTKDLTVGQYSLEVLMDLDEGISLVSPVRVMVKISLKDQPTETLTPTDTSSNIITEPNTSTSQEITTSNVGNGATENDDVVDIPANGGV